MDVGIAVKQQANKKKAAPPPPNPFTGLVEKRRAPAPPNPFGADDEDEDTEAESKDYLITGDEVRTSTFWLASKLSYDKYIVVNLICVRISMSDEGLCIVLYEYILPKITNT